MMGLEPVPLLDIPIQLAAQMRMLFKLAALHGRLEPGDGSREMVAAVAGGLGVRLAAQQAAKLVPLLGWVVSGLLSGLTTWFLGWAAVAYLNGSLEEQARDTFASLRLHSGQALSTGLRGLRGREGATERRAKHGRIGSWLGRKRFFAGRRKERAACSEAATTDTGQDGLGPIEPEAQRRWWPRWLPRLRMPIGRNGQEAVEEEEPCSYDAG
jgi:uncharacterized protein (DUF697 family)